MTTPKPCPTCNGSGRAPCGETKRLRPSGYVAICDRPAGHRLPHEAVVEEFVCRWPDRPLVDDCACEDKTPGHACVWQRIHGSIYGRYGVKRPESASEGCSGGVGNTPPPTCAPGRNSPEALLTESERLTASMSEDDTDYAAGFRAGARQALQWALGVASRPSDVYRRPGKA